MKKIILLSFFFFFILLFVRCKENGISEIEQIYGMYKAVIFTEPGVSDGGVDILAKGGNINVELLENFKAKGSIFIPDNIGSNFSAINQNYSGSFSLKKDTVRFFNTSTILDDSQLFFLVKGKQLESNESLGPRKVIKLIFLKL